LITSREEAVIEVKLTLRYCITPIYAGAVSSQAPRSTGSRRRVFLHHFFTMIAQGESVSSAVQAVIGPDSDGGFFFLAGHPNGGASRTRLGCLKPDGRCTSLMPMVAYFTPKSSLSF